MRECLGLTPLEVRGSIRESIIAQELVKNEDGTSLSE
jgi:hypothetical protein